MKLRVYQRECEAQLNYERERYACICSLFYASPKSETAIRLERCVLTLKNTEKGFWLLSFLAVQSPAEIFHSFANLLFSTTSSQIRTTLLSNVYVYVVDRLNDAF